MTPEQVENTRKLLHKLWPGFQSDSPVDALCDLALKGLQVEAAENFAAEMKRLNLLERDQTSFANKKAEAMREAIRRAVEKAKEGLENGRYASYLEAVAAELEQALNERKET
jgi:hypothetical protein